MTDHAARSMRSRLAVATVVAVAAVVAFASLGGVGLAKNAISLAQYQYGKNRVQVCHKGKFTLSVPQKAADNLVRHGDTMGACASTHRKNKGKHKGESHHAPNPATGTGDQGVSTSSSSHGNGNGNGHGNGDDANDS